MAGGFCPDCGAALESTQGCTQCGHQPRSGLEAVIPYRNVAGLIGYYCGVFGIIPCLGLLLGPAALILGFVGYSAVRRRPEIRGTAHCFVAIALGLLATIANVIGLVYVVGSNTRW